MGMYIEQQQLIFSNNSLILVLVDSCGRGGLHGVSGSPQVLCCRIAVFMLWLEFMRL